MRRLTEQVYLSAPVQEYILDIIEATRYPRRFNLEDLQGIIEFGASPRAAQNLVRAAKTAAFLNGRSYVTATDIKDVGIDVLSHRIILTSGAGDDGWKKDDVVQKVLDRLPLP